MELTNIETVGKLKSYIGNFIVCEHTTGVTWMQKLKSIDCHAKNDKTIKGINLYGDYVAEIKPKFRLYGIENYRTNAQYIIRKPTKEECKKYIAFCTKCKFLGI